MMIDRQAYNIKVTIDLDEDADLFDLADSRCTRGKVKVCKVNVVEKGKTTFSCPSSIMPTSLIDSFNL